MVKVEQLIQKKGLTAPRITPEHIESIIVDKSFTTLPSGKVIVCELVLKNGFSVRGESSCVSKENFDHEVGMLVSYRNAVAQIWPLEGYLLQQSLYETAQTQTQLADFKLDDCDGGGCKI